MGHSHVKQAKHVALEGGIRDNCSGMNVKCGCREARAPKTMGKGWEHRGQHHYPIRAKYGI